MEKYIACKNRWVMQTEMETLGRNQKEMPEIKNSVIELKNYLHGPILYSPYQVK